MPNFGMAEFGMILFLAVLGYLVLMFCLIRWLRLAVQWIKANWGK